MDRTVVRTVPLGMARLTAALVVFACVVAVTAEARSHGKLRIDHPGRGKINLDTGSADFTFRRWDFLLASDSNGIDPANEPVTIGISDEKFLIPAGMLKVSRKGRRFTYKLATERGIQWFELLRRADGSYRVQLKIAGVDLSTLVISDPPICLPFAVIVGDDDGFLGVSFDRPKTFPSKLLTLPGFCTDFGNTWPWL
jgi:hypothetical protein